jgi:hypothetical protein
MCNLVKSFQATAFEMSLNGLISDRDFLILEALTEGMTKDSDALELTAKLTMKDLEDEDVVDSILAREYTTATLILW